MQLEGQVEINKLHRLCVWIICLFDFLNMWLLNGVNMAHSSYLIVETY